MTDQLRESPTACGSTAARVGALVDALLDRSIPQKERATAESALVAIIWQSPEGRSEFFSRADRSSFWLGVEDSFPAEPNCLTLAMSLGPECPGVLDWLYHTYRDTHGYPKSKAMEIIAIFAADEDRARKSARQIDKGHARGQE